MYTGIAEVSCLPLRVDSKIMVACKPSPTRPPVADPTPMNTDQASLRTQLREQMRLQRSNLSPQQRMAAAQGLRRVLDTLPIFHGARHIGGYWARHGEVPLNLALAGIQQREQHYWLPRVQPQRQLEFARWRSGDEVVANRFGIPEPGDGADTMPPQNMDILLVPLLAFDASGNRLGMGGGYYDTTLAFLHSVPRPAKPLLVGIAHAFQQVEQLQPQAWDVPLDMVATENQLFDCTSKRSAK